MIPMKNYLFQTPEDICVQLKKMTHPVTIDCPPESPDNQYHLNK